MIKAGVVLVTEFTKPGSDYYKEYIEYMARETAIRDENMDKFNLYFDYMGNPQKSTGLFSADFDFFNRQKMNAYKEAFEEAQDKGSLMWQTVISFDNTWLEKNGLYNRSTGILDERKIKEVTRVAMKELLRKEEMTGAVWTASIHYNTDNIHVHIATVDLLLERKKKEYVYLEDQVPLEGVELGRREKEYGYLEEQFFLEGVEQGRREKEYGYLEEQFFLEGIEQRKRERRETEFVGKMKLSSINAAKSKVVNEIIRHKDINMQINNMIRDKIIGVKKETELVKDPEFLEKFLNIYENLPSNRRYWKYNMNKLSYVRPMIDELSTDYIMKYHHDVYMELQKMLHQQDELYREAYGGAVKSYYEGKMRDLYERLGNAILMEMREFDRQPQKQEIRSDDEIVLKQKGDIIEKISKDDLEEVPGISEEELAVHEKILEEELPVEENDRREGAPAEMSRGREELRAEERDGREGAPAEMSRGREELRAEERDGREGAPAEMSRGREELRAEERDGRESAPAGMSHGREELRAEERNGREEQEQNYRDKVYILKWSEEYKEAKKLLFGENKNFEEAKKILESEAETGNALAIYDLGMIYEKGIGGDLDQKKAIQYYGRAYEAFEQICTKSENEFEISYTSYRIGKMNYYGVGREKDYETAREFFEDAAKVKNIFAEYNLGKIYQMGQGVEVDIEKALKHYLKAGSVPYAAYEAARIFANKGEEEKANQYYEKAYQSFCNVNEENADDRIQYRLGYMLYHGLGTEKNIEEAEAILEKSAEAQNVYAQLLLTRIYLETGEEEKKEKAVKMLTDLAEKNVVEAQYNLGKIYLKEEYGMQDHELGKQYMKQAAEKGHEIAEYLFGKIIIEENREEGLFYLQSAADKGNEAAEYLFGREILETDREQGLFYLQKAAEKENRAAEYLVGKEFFKEEDIEKVKIGERYLRRAAAKDNVNAQYILGKEFALGDDESRQEEGRKYLEQAAQKGHEYAQYTMGKIYWYGIGIKSDREKAREYFGAAAEQGNIFAQRYLADRKVNGKMAQRTDVNRMRKGRGGRQLVSALEQAARQLKRNMRGEVNHYRNQKEFENMQREHDKQYRAI